MFPVTSGPTLGRSHTLDLLHEVPQQAAGCAAQYCRADDSQRRIVHRRVPLSARGHATSFRVEVDDRGLGRRSKSGRHRMQDVSAGFGDDDAEDV